MSKYNIILLYTQVLQMYKLIRAELGAEFIANIVFRKSINLINFVYTLNIIYISIKCTIIINILFKLIKHSIIICKTELFINRY